MFDNLIKINNKKRIRSKKLLNLFDLVQLELNQHDTINFSITILTGYLNDKKNSLTDSWKKVLPDILEKLKTFFNKQFSDKILLSITSIENHRDKLSVKKKTENSQFQKFVKKNDLNGFPHIHVFVSFLLDSFNDFYFETNNIEKLILSEFVDFDIKINFVRNVENNIKNAVKYLFKEYKLTDINDFLIQNSINQKKISVNLNNYSPSLKKTFNDISNIINQTTENMTINLEENTLINAIKIKDPLYLIEILFKNFIKKNDFKVENDIIYFNGYEPHPKTSYFEFYSLKEGLYILAKQNVQHRNLIISNIKKILSLQDETGFLNNISISDFEYIEYKDFVLNLHKCKIESKNCMDNYSFKYFHHSNKDLLDLHNNLDILSNIFDNDDEFFKYLRQLGSILVQSAPKKGSSMYIYGPSNTGKSLITEKFFIEIFGERHIAVLNFSNPTYLLDQIKNKHIIILNEFKYNKSLREILLKILDGSLVEINEKYKNSIKATIKSKSVTVSNYSLQDQGMLEDAFLNRFSIIKTSLNISPEQYNLILNSLPLVILYATQSLLYSDFNSTKVAIFNLLEDSNKIITISN